MPSSTVEAVWARIRNRVMRSLIGNSIAVESDVTPFTIASSNIAGIHSKMGLVLQFALLGVHAVTETKADSFVQSRVEHELRALNEHNGPDKQVQVLWGPAVSIRGGGVALFSGPPAAGRATRVAAVAGSAEQWSGDSNPP